MRKNFSYLQFMSKKTRKKFIFVITPIIAFVIFLASTFHITKGKIVHLNNHTVFKDEEGTVYSLSVKDMFGNQLNRYAVGDTLILVHKGGTLETYPAQFNRVLVMKEVK